MKKSLLSVFFLACTQALVAQTTLNFEWGRGTNTRFLRQGTFMQTDDTGNLYVLSALEGTVDADPGAGVFNLTSAGGRDILLTKLDPDGSFLWARRFGGTEDDEAGELAIHPSGQVYMTGQFRGTVDFNPGAQGQELTATNNDIFILSLTGSGNFSWVRQLVHDASPWEEIRQTLMDIDEAGNIYVSAGFKGTIDLDPGNGVLNVTASDYSAFVAKYNMWGILAWGKKVGGIGKVTLSALQAGTSGKVYIHGTYEASQFFGNTYLQTDTTQAYVAELNTSGNFSWATVLAKNITIRQSCMAADGDGNLYLTGDYYKKVTFGSGNSMQTFVAPNTNDMIVCKVNNAGNIEWVKPMKTNNLILPQSICSDASGSIYISGCFAGNSDFDPGPAVHLLTTKSASSFTLKINPQGEFVWAAEIFSDAIDLGYAATVDSEGNVYITGQFYGASDIDPTPGVHTLFSPAQLKTFITKISQQEPTPPEAPEPEIFTAIYPNPTSDFLILTTGEENAVLEIFNTAGEIVHRQTEVESYNVIDISEFACGIYIAKLKTGKNSVLESKVVKMH